MEPGSMNLYAELLKTLGMLSLVLALLLGILYLVKRFGFSNIQGINRSGLKLVSSFHLSNREKLVIVEVENERLLLGVTQNNITLITKLKPAEEDEENAVQGEKKDFTEIFKKSLKSQFFQKKDRKK